MKNFKKVIGVLLATIMLASSMATVASAKTVFNGVKVFEEDFGNNGVPTLDKLNTTTTEMAYNSDVALQLQAKNWKVGQITIDYPTPIDLSSIWETEAINIKLYAPTVAVGVEIILYDTSDVKRRYSTWSSYNVREWKTFSMQFTKPSNPEGEFDPAKINKIVIQANEWPTGLGNIVYVDDVIIGSESEIPGTGKYITKTVRNVYKDGFDCAVTYNRDTSGFDVVNEYMENEDTGDNALQLTATGANLKQYEYVACGKSMDLSNDWNNAYLELEIKSTASGYINILPTYFNGADGGQATVAGVEYTFNPEAGADYVKLSIPMTHYTDLSDYKSVITGFSIRAGGACDGATVYVDNVRYVVIKEIATIEAKMNNGVVTVTTGAEEGKIIIAVYDGTILVNVVTADVPAVEPSVDVILGDVAEGNTVKVMIFESIAGATPLTDAIEL